MPCVLYSKHDSQAHNFQVGVVWNKYIVMVADSLMVSQFLVFTNVTSMPNAKETPPESVKIPAGFILGQLQFCGRSGRSRAIRRCFGVDVEKALTDIQQPVFRTVEPFAFPKHTPKNISIYFMLKFPARP